MGASTPKISCGRRIGIAAGEFLSSRASTPYISCGRRKAKDFFSLRLRASGLKLDFIGESADSDILARLIDFFLCCCLLWLNSDYIYSEYNKSKHCKSRMGVAQGAKATPNFLFFFFFLKKYLKN
jgi:hypothetical protein